jgi:uncharacterized protein
MRLDDLPESDNIEDRRGEEGGGFGQGGGFGIPIGGRGGLGIGTIVVLGLIGYAFGIDPSILIGGAEILSGGSTPTSYNSPPPQRQTSRPTDDTGRFVSRVLGSTEVQWTQILAAQGKTYQRPRLVLFNQSTDSACGMAQRAMGPFYCPNDREIYLDTSFFDELQNRFRGCNGRACQFAEAYVIAHEVGHHVQNLLGILPKVQQAQRAMSTPSRNALQVKVELQADCFGGVWAHHSEEKWKFIEPGDVEAALQTASAIGDDRLQRAARGVVMPDSFTHGTSEQRSRWFSVGLKNGTIAACDTFNAPQL